MAQVRDATATELVLSLTERETDILRHLLHGRNNDVIARALNVSESTVKLCVGSLLQKGKWTNRTQAATWAFAHKRESADGAIYFSDVVIVAKREVPAHPPEAMSGLLAALSYFRYQLRKVPPSVAEKISMAQFAEMESMVVEINRLSTALIARCRATIDARETDAQD